MQRVLTERPDVSLELANAWHAAAHVLDPALLHLCRLRVAMLLGCTAELDDPELVAALPDWPTADRFDARDRAVLALTEQFVIDVANIDDALLAQARAHLGDGLADFLNALLVTEQRQRLSLAWERLLV